MKVWFTADHHFGHNNVIAYDKRPFGGLKEMHEELILRHNAVVRKEDLVYMLGDVVWHKKAGDECIPRLNGNLIFVGGGHDHNYFKQKNCPIVHFKRDNYELYLCHFPLLSWPALSHGVCHVHGHSHGKGPVRPNALDVGVMCWDYYPVRLEQVQEYFTAQKKSLDIGLNMWYNIDTMEDTTMVSMADKETAVTDCPVRHRELRLGAFPRPGIGRSRRGPSSKKGVEHDGYEPTEPGPRFPRDGYRPRTNPTSGEPSQGNGSLREGGQMAESREERGLQDRR